MVGTATDNPRFLARLVRLDGDGVLTDVLEPDILETAMALAMNTFGLRQIN